MKREPAMHIKLSDFAEILLSSGVVVNREIARKTAILLFQKAIPFAVKDRYLISGNAEVQKKAKRVMNANKDLGITVEKFNRMLVEQRFEAGHRNIRTIRPGDTAFLQLREIAQLATDFCNELEYTDYDMGCKVFISIGIDMMGREYRQGMFKTLAPKIKGRVVALERLNSDSNEGATKEFYEIWKLEALKYTRVEWALKKPEEYVHMLYAREDADSINAGYKDWIVSIFEDMQQYGRKLYTASFYGEDAIAKYRRYKSIALDSEKAVNVTVKEYKSSFSEKYDAAKAKISKA